MDGLHQRKVGSRLHRAHGPGVVTKLSPWSVADTVTRLLSVAGATEMTVLAVIDRSGEAADVGLRLRHTKLVILVDPAAQTPVMEAAPLAALTSAAMPR